MEKIIFLILHYYTIEDTIKCIESIEKLNYKNKEIVVVDNGSPNDSGIELEKLYKKSKNIHIILSKENLGFARGNNLGFKYAKEKLNADFIVMCNNDTKIIESNFIKQIITKYQEHKYSVLGPKIKLKDNSYNKLYLKLPTSIEFKKEIKYFKKMLILNYLHLEEILRYLKHLIKKQNNNSKFKEQTNKFQENIILHGCFLVFLFLFLKAEGRFVKKYYSSSSSPWS